ncbi:LEAF RUST 10 DISEASE-RESISTANCE LOCUS RECEPTOR-LIKE PROTEIN KINASE-like 1.2 isoform X1 [Phragmites australis]|uniref:LEAF RUST 10 DISEASE-RESISTANCE LOCUS RECEPTOR-LIKE PROTEIN KINASE-like 1.2 isoform X1 n=1 Tax=Phragmites australis TaxID=29695 RepID=UPI002D77F9BD|nr:LEAF RUST 10 DISEASE-RESISTANCE LOCUS RECEPTOR-LIKE PROTEIN KINASE-like 1.2 isoform X1 [Phragmites australis]
MYVLFWCISFEVIHSHFKSLERPIRRTSGRYHLPLKHGHPPTKPRARNPCELNREESRQPAMPSLLLLLLFLAAAESSRGDDTYAASACRWQPYLCGSVHISYPFYLSNETEVLKGHDGESYCGYPGLAVRCDGGSKAVLQLGDDNYTVSRIDYANLTVSLADTDAAATLGGGCPSVDHNVTIPPDVRLFFPISVVDYLFFFVGCSFGGPKPGGDDAPKPPKPPTIKPITCGGALSYVIPRDKVPPGDWSGACRDFFLVPVLRESILSGEQDPWWRSDGYGKALRAGFLVGWDRSSGQCGQCEQSNGKCGYSRAGAFLGCLCANGRVDSNGCGPKKKTKAIIAGVVGGFFVFLVAGVTAILFIRKRKRKEINSSSKLLKYSGSGGTPRSRGGDMESGSIQDLKTHLFSYEELEEATDCFNDNRELGDGGFGTVYKGYLKDGRVVAVKRLYNNSYRRVEQFVNEAAILSRLRHPSLVMFYGCTSSQSRELLLVYEFVANGTVADHLHGHRASEHALSWPLRLSIAVESAAALTYLHAIEPPIVHRDVKTTNILLDSDFHVKVADFGLSRLFPLDVTHVSTAPQGTPGYVDPEYHQCYQLTDKSDVYSFGVVLVELISSKPAVDITRHRNEINLAYMAINKIQKCQLEQLVDLGLGYEADPATKKAMTMVAELAFRCLQQNGEMRPPIKEVLEGLKAIQDECRMETDGDKNKEGPFSPNTVHAPWDSRATTPNTSQ